MPGRRVMVIGWDSAAPAQVFGQWREELPHLRQLIVSGLHGPLRSTDPPITVPAWTAMMSSRNPGALGCYGFRNRTVGTYDGKWLATAEAVRVPRVWDLASAAGKRVCVLNVPQTYPLGPLNGVGISCFLTPSTDNAFVTPPELTAEVQRVSGGYMLDVDNFRTDDKRRLRDDIIRLTDKQFAVARHLLQREPWDFFMHVCMGLDRLGHGFWKHCDPAHPQYQPGSPFADVMREYAQRLDAQLGELVALAGEDVTVLVVSDHGAKAMHGSLSLNEWLLSAGYLVLKAPVAGLTRFDESLVDWSRTTAWGWGGYYGRVFLNVQGREPQGIVPAERYAAVRDELARRLEAIPDPEGRPLATRAMAPEALYPGSECRDAPDLLVYFDDLRWRAGQDLGQGGIWSSGTEIGPDDSVHDTHGIFVMAPVAHRAGEAAADLSLLDVAPTVLKTMGLAVPPDMEGQALV